ncbi:hypothetical protein NMG60_11021963 [Bertholletia excelsa]
MPRTTVKKCSSSHLSSPSLAYRRHKRKLSGERSEERRTRLHQAIASFATVKLQVAVLMASKLQQLQSKASQASQFVAKHGTAYYKQLMEQNKQHVQEPPTVEKCNLLAKQLFYTRLASIPGRYESFWKELDYLKHIWKNRQELKVEDAGIAALFGLECFAWFCAGEIVGRGFTITGYYP